MIEKGFYNMDCMDAMKEFPDNFFDIAVVDPPYGIGITESGRLKKYNAGKKRWDDNIPSPEYFKELFRIAKNSIIWGGNYFDLPPTKCFLIWDKKQPEAVSFASAEYAWTDMDGVAKTFYYSPMNQSEKRIHPTQKPRELYDWIFAKYTERGMKFLDTHVGSGSSLISAHYAGLESWGFEIDAEFYERASERIKYSTAQMSIFDIL